MYHFELVPPQIKKIVQPVANYKVSIDIGRGKKQQLIADNAWSARSLQM
jgi:hypothetical protein